MTEAQGPEHWIGELVMVRLSDVDPRAANQRGFLEGVSNMGITILVSPELRREGGTGPPVPANITPQHVFYPWHRINLIAREVEQTTAIADD